MKFPGVQVPTPSPGCPLPAWRALPATALPAPSRDLANPPPTGNLPSASPGGPQVASRALHQGTAPEPLAAPPHPSASGPPGHTPGWEASTAPLRRQAAQPRHPQPLCPKPGSRVGAATRGLKLPFTATYPLRDRGRVSTCRCLSFPA